MTVLDELHDPGLSVATECLKVAAAKIPPDWTGIVVYDTP